MKTSRHEVAGQGGERKDLGMYLGYRGGNPGSGQSEAGAGGALLEEVTSKLNLGTHSEQVLGQDKS